MTATSIVDAHENARKNRCMAEAVPAWILPHSRQTVAVVDSGGVVGLGKRHRQTTPPPCFVYDDDKQNINKTKKIKKKRQSSAKNTFTSHLWREQQPHRSIYTCSIQAVSQPYPMLRMYPYTCLRNISKSNAISFFMFSDLSELVSCKYFSTWPCTLSPFAFVPG